MVNISEKAARLAKQALQSSIQRKALADSLDGAPSRRGQCKVDCENHRAHSEIAIALGDETNFAISAYGEPSPDDIIQASDLAHLLIAFWIKRNDWARRNDNRIPPGPSSDLALTLTKFCMVSPSTARRIISTAAKGQGWELMSMGDWLEVTAS
jgi:hypothetical protein